LPGAALAPEELRLIEQIGQAVVTTDRAGRITHVNASATELYGWTLEQLAGRELVALAASPSYAEDLRRAYQTMLEGRRYRGELHVRAPRHHDELALVTASPMLDGGGRPKGSIFTFTRMPGAKRTALLDVAARVGRWGAWEIDGATGSVTWSSEVRKILEVSPDFEPNLESALAFYTPESRARARSAVERCFEYGTSFDEELELVTPRGRTLWVRAIGEAEKDAEGTIVRIHGAFHDVSQSMLAAAAVKLSEERFRLLAKATTDAVWDLDLIGDKLWWNDGIETLFGYARSEAARPGFRDARIHPEDREDVRARIEAAVTDRRDSWDGEYRFRRADGGYTPVMERGYILRGVHGLPVRLIGGMADISERRRFAESVAQQSALMEAASDAIFHTDLEGRVLSWNRAAEAIYGYGAAEAIGRSARELLYGDASQFDQALTRVQSERTWRGELRQRHKDGRGVTADVRLTLIFDARDRPTSVLAISTDVTDRKRLEAQMLRAQRMESVGTLASGIAHDLNNILSPIMMAVGALQAEVTSEEAREVLETLQSCSERGAALVRQVLLFARGVEGERLNVDPSRLLKDIQQIARETFPKNISIRVDYPRELWTVHGDPTQLHQVFMNLCVNARDAMPTGGSLKIALSNVRLDDVYAQMHIDARAGNYVLVSVSDTGHGIDPGIVEKIFEPFFTTKELGNGTGLGLATSATIVRSHAGFINVYSEVGQGTTFNVYLPAAEANPRSPSDRPPEHLPRGNGELILVADDEAAVRKVTESTLLSFGYRVLVAEDGAEALSTFARHQDEVALVLTDMMMPIVDGPTLIAALRRMAPRVRIVAASGLHSHVNPQRSRVGADEFLEKPYTASAMLTLFRSLLDTRRTSPPPS